METFDWGFLFRILIGFVIISGFGSLCFFAGKFSLFLKLCKEPDGIMAYLPDENTGLPAIKIQMRSDVSVDKEYLFIKNTIGKDVMKNDLHDEGDDNHGEGSTN